MNDHKTCAGPSVDPVDFLLDFNDSSVHEDGGDLSLVRRNKNTRTNFSIESQLNTPDGEVFSMEVDKTKSAAQEAGQVLLGLGAGAAIGFGWISQDWIAAGFVLAVLLLSLRGSYKGGAAIAASILAMLAAFRWSSSLVPILAPSLQYLDSVPQEYQGFFHLAAAGLAIALGVYLLVRITAGLLLRTFPGLKPINRWFGAVLGALQGGMIAVLVLFSALVLEPMAVRQVQNATSTPPHGGMNKVCGHLIRLVDHARHSALRPLIVALDPLKNDLHERAREMAQTVSLRTVTDPKIQASLSQLAQELRQDPKALQKFASQFGIEEQAVRAFLDASVSSNQLLPE